MDALMIPTAIVASLGFGSGAWAALQNLKRNGNGHSTNGSSPSEPSSQVVQAANQITDSAFSAALNAHFASQLESMKSLTERVAEVVVDGVQILKKRADEPQPDPKWVQSLETRFAAHTAALARSEAGGWTQEATHAIERVVERLNAIQDRMEAILQMGPAPLLEATERVELVALIRTLGSLPGEIEESVEQIGKQQQESERKLLTAVKSNGGNSPPPPPRRDPPQPRAIPHPLPPIPHIPPPYIGGTVVVSGSKPENLLLLIQQQLQPNCPGTCVQFRISSDDEIFVGAASFLGGPLTEDNYAYKLEPEKPRIYQSTYPGNSTPIGDLQVLGSGEIHIEVQL